MASTLKQIGDMASALFYQNYRADDQFFDLPHFKFLIATKYAEIFNAEYQRNKKENRLLTGYSWVEISPDLLYTETLPLKQDVKNKNQWYVELSQNIFLFNWDAMASGVQFVNIGGDCGSVVRISKNDVFALCHMPVTDQAMYYVESANKIIFVNYKCQGGNPSISYLPAIDCANDDSVIGDEHVNQIIIEILNLMFGAKNGNIVDMSNNTNPNTVQQTELSTNALKQ